MGCQNFSDQTFMRFLGRAPYTCSEGCSRFMKASIHISPIPRFSRVTFSGLPTPENPPDNRLIAAPRLSSSAEVHKEWSRRVVRMPTQASDPGLPVNRLIVQPQVNSGEIISIPHLMWRLERVWEERNRTPVLLASVAIILIIALADWWTKPFVAFGVLYLFPIMLVAGFLPRWVIALLGAGCALLSEIFSSLDRSTVRLGFETLALAGCGLFVAELVRNRRLTLEGRERLKALVETSPAAIMTVDDSGFIELANQAAVELLAPRDGKLIGNPVSAFLPELHHALRWEEAPQFRASMQCRGHRGNGESFTADVWFSTYKEGATPKLAAIIADVTEETAADGSNSSASEQQERAPLTDRELGVLRSLVQGLANKEIATRMEVSESTIKNTLQQLFAKTNVRTRAQLVRVALEQYRDVL
jgi:PAS domain S-box-containing protein